MSGLGTGFGSKVIEEGCHLWLRLEGARAL